MKGNIKSCIALAAILFGWSIAPNSSALGLGGYVELGKGYGELTLESYFGGDREFDIDTDHLGFGFTLDTNLRDNGVFNYRLGVGFENFKINFDAFKDEPDLNGITVTNDFGFAFIQRQGLRVWAGPQLRLGYYNGDSQFNEEYSIIAAGVGPVIGGNFGINQDLNIGVKAGYITSGFAGIVTDQADNDFDVTGGYSQFFINGSLFFE